MPTKTWVQGEDVLAADFNTYVQKQVIPTFASAAARDTAIPTPTAGQIIYNSDDGGGYQTYLTGASTGWRWLPRGVIYSYFSNTDVASGNVGTTPAVIWTGPSLTFYAGHVYRYSFGVALRCNVSGSLGGDAFLTVPGWFGQTSTAVLPAANVGILLTPSSVIRQQTTGTGTPTLSIKQSWWANQAIHYYVDIEHPLWISIEHLGQNVGG